MINTNNLCIFEGRVSSDANYSTIQMGQEQVEKAMFRIAVERALSSAQRQKAKTDNSIKTADFIPCSLLGAQVATFRQYFPKGTPIKVVGHYTEYQKTNTGTGQTEYGHIFEIDNIGFTVSNNNGGNNNNSGNNGGGQRQAPAQNSQPRQQPAPQQQPQQSNFTMFDEADSPF